MDKTRILIDPDGTADPGLLVLIEAPTGIVYQAQVGGHYTENREGEGFLVPVGSEKQSISLRKFFLDTFRSWPPSPSDPTAAKKEWTSEQLAALEQLVSKVRIWRPGGGREYRPQNLALDRSRLENLTESWVPVLTP